MNKYLLQGELVRLAAEDPQPMSEAFSRWGRNSTYIRLLGNDPASLWSTKKYKEWLEKDLEKDQPTDFFFTIRTLADDRLVGFVGLFGTQWNHGDAWVGIGIGEPGYWGKGYGTDAMRTVLRYAFTELNLHRVSLGVFGYNQRAIRSYEKAGFRMEGCARQHMHREGRRWDLYYMGILHEEWEKRAA